MSEKFNQKEVHLVCGDGETASTTAERSFAIAAGAEGTAIAKGRSSIAVADLGGDARAVGNRAIAVVGEGTAGTSGQSGTIGVCGRVESWADGVAVLLKQGLVTVLDQGKAILNGTGRVKAGAQSLVFVRNSQHSGASGGPGTVFVFLKYGGAIGPIPFKIGVVGGDAEMSTADVIYGLAENVTYYLDESSRIVSREKGWEPEFGGPCFTLAGGENENKAN